jgi:hypothetical protein
MITLRNLIFLILIIGLGLFLYSLSLDYYTDKQVSEELISGSCDIGRTEYYKREAELRTNKTTLMDLGAGITVSAIVLLGFFFTKRIRNLSDLIKIKSISRTMIFILSNVIWLILIPGTHFYYIFRGGRGDYPPFADSIGIPIMTQIPLLLILMIPLNLFIGLTLIKSTIPTRIFIKADNYIGKSIFWEIFFGFWLLINLFCFVIFVTDGDHFSIPVNMFFTYVLLTLRAGQISKWTKENNNEINASAHTQYSQ